MGLQPILSVIQPVTIDSILNKNGLKDVMCKQRVILQENNMEYLFVKNS